MTGYWRAITPQYGRAGEHDNLDAEPVIAARPTTAAGRAARGAGCDQLSADAAGSAVREGERFVPPQGINRLGGQTERWSSHDPSLTRPRLGGQTESWTWVTRLGGQTERARVVLTCVG